MFRQYLLITSAFLLLDELSMYKGDIDGFFSGRVVYRSSTSSCNSTDSLLIAVDYQLSFLAYLCC